MSITAREYPQEVPLTGDGSTLALLDWTHQNAGLPT